MSWPDPIEANLPREDEEAPLEDQFAHLPHPSTVRFLGPQDVSSEHCPVCDETRRGGDACPVHVAR